MHFRKSGYTSNILHTPLKISTYPLQKSTYPLQILHTPSKHLRTPSKNLHTPTHTQVGLALYLANMFKAMKASSRELEVQLEKMGTPNQFPKVLSSKKIEWERLQSMDLRTLYASLCFHGATEKWIDIVSDLCDGGMHIADLLFKLRTVERSINPGTDAKVIHLPTARIMYLSVLS